jgi:hypothetical protein
MHWERLKSDRFDVFRAAVPGGWLVMCHSAKRWQSDICVMGDPQFRRIESILLRMEEAILVRMEETGNAVFLPDPEHQWDGTSPKVDPEMRIGE